MVVELDRIPGVVKDCRIHIAAYGCTLPQQSDCRCAVVVAVVVAFAAGLEIYDDSSLAVPFRHQKSTFHLCLLLLRHTSSRHLWLAKKIKTE